MTDRVALVTGGSRGIGRAIVLALVQAGWKVLFSYRKDAAAAEETITQAGGGESARAVQADQSDSLAPARLLDATFDAFGRLDLLVNNAGMAPRQRRDLLDIDENSYDEVMAANLKGAFFLSQTAARHMLSQPSPPGPRRGIIINIGSISAYTSSVNRAEYCLSKAGMGMLTSLFGDRLAGEGILVYELRPGIMRTDMTAAALEKYDRLIGEGLLPIPRWGTPEDVAQAVVMLASGALPYSTGEVINVDGGFHLRRL